MKKQEAGLNPKTGIHIGEHLKVLEKKQGGCSERADLIEQIVPNILDKNGEKLGAKIVAILLGKAKVGTSELYGLIKKCENEGYSRFWFRVKGK